MDGDAEGVWSPDIEQSFQEALAIYPPCGRRKIILSDEGKMYGRNELIARYIKLRTGKTRTRKQVSSHIQVLARKKVREFQAGIKVAPLYRILLLMVSLSFDSGHELGKCGFGFCVFCFALPHPTQLTPSTPPPLLHHSPHPSLPSGCIIKPFAQTYANLPGPVPPPISAYEPLAPPLAPSATAVPVWQDRTIASSKLRMLEYSAFMEVPRDQDSYSKHLFVHIGQTNPSYSDPLLEAVDIRQIYDKFPEKKGGLKELYEKGPQNAFFLVKFWADLNSSDMQDGPGSFYGVSSQYCSTENMTITVSTKVCSFGKQVVEKVEVSKVKHLETTVVTNRETQETLLCIAFVFEVSTSEHGAQYHVYRLIKD
uniref:TEA domain family member 3 b n=1 Tax=Astyanax mexicanus TaxID=7994 RepID=A0A8B9HFE1_ASTMX